jgi:hypothetical protein
VTALPETLLIATPAYQATVRIEYTRALLETHIFMSKRRCQIDLAFLSECARISKARNDLIRLFMQSDHGHMLMVDGDISWPPEAPAYLIAKDKPFVGAVTVKRGTNQMCLRNIDNSGSYDYDPASRLLRVGAIGTGFVLIRRDMIEAMERAYPNLLLSEERGGHPTYGLFNEMITPAGSSEGEDFSFSERWRAIGGEVFVDPWIPLSHVWSQSFRGCLAEDMKLPRPTPALAAAE